VDLLLIIQGADHFLHHPETIKSSMLIERNLSQNRSETKVWDLDKLINPE